MSRPCTDSLKYVSITVLDWNHRPDPTMSSSNTPATTAPMTNSPSLTLWAWALTGEPPRLRHSCRLHRGFGLAPEELAHPRIIAGVAKHLRIALGDDALRPLVEHDDAIGDRVDAGELVRDDDEGDVQAAGQPPDQGIELRRSDRIQARRRLVQEQDSRIERHRPRDRRALLHPAADLGRHMAAERLETDQLELHARDQVHRRQIKRRVFLERQADILEQRHRTEQRTTLVHHADLGQDCTARCALRADDILAVDQDLARHRLIEPDHVLQERALAAARGTENDEHLAAIDGEIHVLEQNVAVVAGDQTLDADDRRGIGGVAHWTATLAASLAN